MIYYKRANTTEELESILQLQRKNLPANLTEEEIKSQGFVTVIHSFEDLKKLNDIETHVIAKDGEKVIAYILAMTEQSQFDIPVLKPMFEIFQQVFFAGKQISDYRYIVIGQVCVDKQYRSKGILDECYQFYKDSFKGKYDFVTTEIATSNLRSLNAHKRIGFKDVHHFTGPEGTDWVIVLWDWNNFAST